MDLELKDFRAGDSVELHPATDLWMRGVRFGEVVSVGRKLVLVKLDRLARPVKVAPRNIGACWRARR
jgi:hypothetical protein